MKRIRKLECIIIAFMLILTACFQYVSFASAADQGTPQATEVTRVLSGHSGNQLSIFLSESDYGALSILGEKHAEYSYWTDILVYSSETEYKPLNEVAAHGDYYYGLAGEGSINLNMQGAEETAVKIVIPAGTVFPAVAYTGGEGAAWGPTEIAATSTAMNGYVVEKEITLTRPSETNDLWGSTPIYSWNIEVKSESTPVGTPEPTEVTRVLSGHSGNHMSIFLSESDYGALSILGEKHAEYSYWTNILVYTSETEYKPLNEVAAHEDYYYGLAGPGSINLNMQGAEATAVKIVIPAGTVFPSVAYTGGVGAGWGPTDIAATSTAMNGYVVEKEITLTRPSETNDLWGETPIYSWNIEVKSESTPVGTPEPTEVTRVLSGHSGNHMSIFLSENDYGALSILGEKHAEYSYWTDILVYSSETEYKPLNEVAAHGDYYYGLAGEGSINLNMQGAEATAVKIVIPAGTVFPAVAYTGGEGAAWGPTEIAATSTAMNGYVVEKEITLTRPSETNDLWGTTPIYSWNIEVKSESAPVGTPEPTEVTRVLSGHNGNHMSIFLSESDYGALSILGEKHAEYSYWTDILVYSSETEYKPLNEVAAHGDYYYGLAGEGSINLNMQGAEATAVKIVIPAGTVFPSVAYTGGEGAAWGPTEIAATSTAMNGYVVEKEITLTRPSETNDLWGTTPIYSWNIEVEGESAPVGTPEPTEVTRVLSGHSGNHMSIFLSESDYGALSILGEKHAEYSYWTDILVYSSETEYKPLNEVAAHEDYYYGLAGEGSINLNMQGAEATAVKIVIPAGTVFPAVAYTGGVGAAWGPTEIAATSTAMNGYVVEKEITLTRPSETNDLWGETPIYSWNIEVEGENAPVGKTEETEVLSAHLLGAKNDVRVILTLKTNDYADIGDSVAVSEKHKNYTTMQHIYLGKDGVMIPLSQIVSEEVYYNLWGYEGSISYGLQSQYSWDSFDEVIIEAGCDFPSYVYTSSTNSIDKKQYVTTSSKSIEIQPVTHKVTYYDENKNVLYEDDIISGSVFSMRDVPQKEGFLGKWEGLKYDVMPAQDISYQLAYIDDATSALKKPDVLQEETTKDVTESPATGDAFEATVPKLFVLLLASAAILLAGWMKSYIGGRHGRE